MKNFNPNFLKLSIGIIIFAIVILLFYFNNKLLDQTKEHNRWVTYTYRVMNESFILFDDVIDIGNYYKEYLYTKSQKSLMEYHQKKEKNEQGFYSLKELVYDNNQQLRLDSLQVLYNLKLRQLDTTISKVYENRYTSADYSDILDVEDDELSLKIKGLIEDFNIHEKELLKLRSDRSSQSHQYYFMYSVIGGCFILSLIGGFYLFLMKEINNKKKSERELFIKTEWYNKTLFSIGDAVIATDKNGIITYINKSAQEITEWNEEEAVGKNVDFVFNIISDTTGEPAENPLMNALTEGRTFLLSDDIILKTKSGKRIYIDDSGSPIFDDTGEIIGGVLIFRGIDDKILLLKHLEAEKQKLNEILNNTNTLVTIRDTKGNYLFANRQYEKVMNLPKEKIVGKNVSEMNNVADFYKSGKLISRLTESDDKVINERFTDSFEYELKFPDGKMHTLIFNKFPLLDVNGNVSSICTTATDITESKLGIENEVRLQYLEHIQKSELKFMELIENMPVMYYTVDNDLKITFWNKATEKFTKMNFNNVKGKYIHDLFSMEEIPIEAHYREVLTTQTAKSFIFNFTMYGTNYVTEVTLYPTNGGVAGISYDITDQRHTENATKELIESLQKRNNELKQFAYIISHNLRAPISKIQGLASLFDTDPDDEELNKTIVDNIKTASDDLDTVVSDINNVISLRESEEAVSEYVMFDVELNFVKQLLDAEIKKCDNVLITSDFNKPAGMTTLKSNIHMILLNLLSNAIKYRSPERNLHVHFTASQDAHYVNISIEDNGIGIDLNKFGKKLFMMYKRFHGNEIEGRGLGLYLVKSQVEGMNGQVEVESEINKGTKFTIRLPKK